MRWIFWKADKASPPPQLHHHQPPPPYTQLLLILIHIRWKNWKAIQKKGRWWKIDKLAGFAKELKWKLCECSPFAPSVKKRVNRPELQNGFYRVGIKLVKYVGKGTSISWKPSCDLSSFGQIKSRVHRQRTLHPMLILISLKTHFHLG